MRGMLITRAYRLAAQASLLARVYGGYKLIQALGRAGLVEADGHYARHHRRSAEATYRLATRLEGLPIKVCQFLGSRADILPAEYVDVLSALQDRVPPRPLAQLRPYLERELGAPVGDVFTDLDPVPLASASLAQVHRARLRDGREVPVKIQYPEIADLVAIDLENFALLFGVLARLEPNLDLRVVLEEVQKYVPLELDFCHEAANAERMAEHLAARADVLVPAIVREWSTRRVLGMDYAPGDPERPCACGPRDAGALRRRDAAAARHGPARRDSRRRAARRPRDGTALGHRQAARLAGGCRCRPAALPRRRGAGLLGARPETHVSGRSQTRA